MRTVELVAVFRDPTLRTHMCKACATCALECVTWDDAMYIRVQLMPNFIHYPCSGILQRFQNLKINEVRDLL